MTFNSKTGGGLKARFGGRTQHQPGSDECIVQAIHVELSERGRERGGCVPVAACSIAEVEGTAAPICNLARKLLALGVDPATHLSIRRGEMQCFHDAPLGRWAELTVEEGGSEPVFRRHKPFPGRAVASLRAKSGVRHGQRPKDGTALCEAKTSNRIPVLAEEIKQAYMPGILYRWPPKPKQAAWLRSLVERLGGRFDE